jgi:YD repeat-containing protein
MISTTHTAAEVPVRSLVAANDRSAATARSFGAFAHGLLLLTFLVVSCVSAAQAQSSYAPVVITPPVVDAVDENHVSILSGKTQFSVPAVKLGDVSFAPFTYSGTYFTHTGLQDNNYGQILACEGTFPLNGVFEPECSTSDGGYGVQAIYGEQRATFDNTGSGYVSQAQDGSTFVDNGTTCTWTQRDGTQIVFAAYRQSGNPECLSNNILSVTHPDGRILTYYYYPNNGSFSTTANVQSPIISIASNTGYLLKYNYSGTPVFSMETSVTAINRAYESCDPTAVSCSLQNTWPTATLTWLLHTVSPCDGFYAGEGDCIHTTFTVQDAAQRNYVFELDSTSRVISYQPPEATSAVYSYSLCSWLLSASLECGGYIAPPPTPGGFDPRPLAIDTVSTVTRNGQTWGYGSEFSTGAPPGHGDWGHSVTTPLGTIMHATGNATPGTETSEGPTDSITHYDNTVDQFWRNTQNSVLSVTTPAGVQKRYAYDGRDNLTQITQIPISGSGLANIVETATYPEPGAYPCANIYTCNKPTAVIDANSNETDFTYDSYGNMLTQTDPAAPNGIRPEIQRTYVQGNAWYLNSSGTMTEDSNPIWLLATESTCATTAASGSGCAGGSNDQIVTTYDYGPNSGPNNLILRGKTVTGYNPVTQTIQTLRSCYAHDMQGNKIWETSPNANPSSCPAY